MKKTQAFTLIEVLIAITLAAILFALVFRSYVSITQISTRIENEKKLNAEIAYVTETVQNIADTYQIDYAKYGSTLTSTNGWTNVLHLTGAGISGAALMFSGNNLFRVRDNIATALVSTGSAYISNASFKITPLTKSPNDAFLAIRHPGFRLMASFQTAKYNPQEWIRDVSSSLQQFYNLQRVE